MSKSLASALFLTLVAGCLAGCSDSGSSADAAVEASVDGAGDAAQDARSDMAPRDVLARDMPLTPPPADICSAGWCLRHPLPFPATLYSAWTRTAVAPAKLYAVGDVGTILTYDGATWRRMSSGVVSPLLGVWGRGASDLYVSTSIPQYHVVRHHDGTTWREVFRTERVGSITAISGTASHLYLTTYESQRGRVVRQESSGFVRVHSAPLAGTRYLSIATSNGGQVVAVGTGGAIAAFDASSWKNETSGTVNMLNGAVFVGGEAYVVGANGTVLRRAMPGAPWKPMATGTSATLYAVWGQVADDVYAVGELQASLGARRRYVVLHFDGKSWSKVYEGSPASASTNATGALRAVTARDSDVIAVGLLGTVVGKLAGAGWKRISSRATDTALFSAWVDDSRVVVGGHSGQLLEQQPNNRWVTSKLGLPFTVRALWGISNVLYAAGSGAIYRHDGSTWSAVSPGDNQVSVFGLWGASENDVFAVGQNGIVLRYDGKTLKPMASGTSLTMQGVWGVSASAVFAVGGNAVIKYDGTQWSTLTVGDAKHDYRGVWGTSASNLYVVGRDGEAKKALVRRYDGNAWTDVLIDSDAVLTNISGTGPSDVVAVGSSGLVASYDGTKWIKQSIGIPYTLTSVRCSPKQGCFAVSLLATVVQRAPTP